GFGGLLYGFSSAGNSGWTDPYVIISLVIGAVSLTTFILRQFKLDEPILEFCVFKNKIFTVTTVITMIAFMGLIGAETLLPIYMQNMAGYTALESGLMILPGALVMVLMSPINGRIFDRIGARWLVIIGLSIVTVTTLFYTQLTATTSFTYLTVVFAIRMFGISMVMMPATTAGLYQMPNRLITNGTALNNTMRQVAASIDTAMLITVMTDAALEKGKAADPIDLIRGVNVAFYVTTEITVIAHALSFFIKRTTPAEKHAEMKGQGNE